MFNSSMPAWVMSFFNPTYSSIHRLRKILTVATLELGNENIPGVIHLHAGMFTILVSQDQDSEMVRIPEMELRIHFISHVYSTTIYAYDEKRNRSVSLSALGRDMGSVCNLPYPGTDDALEIRWIIREFLKRKSLVHAA